jgi:1,4-dihydroxy-2-naphthoate octaprenyltransferase
MLKKIFYIVAAILIIIWAVGFFVYALGALVHLLLILAILLIAFRVARGSKKKHQDAYHRYPQNKF